MKKFKVTYNEIVKYEYEIEAKSREDLKENIWKYMNNQFNEQDGHLIDGYVENIEEMQDM